MTTTNTPTATEAALTLDRLKTGPAAVDGLQVRVAPDPHWIRLVVADDDGAVEMRWLGPRNAAAPFGLSVVLHSAHPVGPGRLYEEIGEDCEFTGDEVTVGVCYPDTVVADTVRHDLWPLLENAGEPGADLAPVIAVLAGYHRRSLNR
ncbi:hypothetical protein WIS52_19175 [Pseudonocardia nematodicida]|uniref:SsgA family sporulation/cell division regulator n=1 Tax=Pseudonocardia nematodicida TaxID=1206997 RepID=A0ABV1KDR0_9PSEU